MFQLNSQEKAKVVANCDHLGKLKSYFNHVTIRDLFPLDTRYSSLGTLPGHETRVTIH